MGQRIATTLLTIPLLTSGCGTTLSLFPTPCLPCPQTQDSFCDDLILKDGTHVRYRYAQGNPDLPAVVAAHGFTRDYRDVDLSFSAWPRLSFSFPGHLCSEPFKEGSHTLERFAEVLEEVIEQNKYLFGDNYIIAGGSMGGMVVAKHAVMRANMGLEDKIGRVIITSQDVPPLNPLGYLLTWFVDFWDSSLFNDLRPLRESLASIRELNGLREELREKTNCNWVIISGEDDTLTPDGKEMAKSLGQRAHYHELPGWHDVCIEKAREIEEIVLQELDFLTQLQPSH